MKIKRWETSPDGTYVDLFGESGKMRIYGITEDILRCVYSPEGEIGEESPLGINVKAAQKLEVKRNEKECRGGLAKSRDAEENGILEICTDRLRLLIDLSTARFTWYRKDGDRLLLEEMGKELQKKKMRVFSTLGEPPAIRRVHTVDGDRNFIDNLRPCDGEEAYRARLFFKWQEGEQIHGLGQGEDGIYNYRGHVQYLYQHNMRIPMPWLLSDRGYAILADCGSLMTFHGEGEEPFLDLYTVSQLDYYFVAGEKPEDLIRGFRKLTGRACMLPKWAFGYVQSRERYHSQQELVEIAREYRKRGVGLDLVVQDWKTWRGDRWGEKVPDPERFPDLAAMRKELHSLHVHSMVSVWPNMNYNTKDCDEMQEKGFLLNDLSTYNAFDREARELYWKQAEEGLYRDGFDSWWCDSTEPFSGPDWGGEKKREPLERFHIVGDEHNKYLGEDRANLYALYHALGIFENQTKSDPAHRVLNLTRSGYAGIQKYGAVLWSGDVAASWDTLRKQLTESLNMALSGYPYWTFDAGGFFVVKENWQARGCGCNEDPAPKWFWQGDFEEGVKDPGYRELYVRWLQMAAFLPMMRSHGTDTPREIWQFGEPGDPYYDAIAEAIALRYRLMPYLYSLAGEVYWEDGLMERPLLMDFSEDPRAAASDEAFMLGKSLLVCPVMKPLEYGPGGVKLWEPRLVKCYLPAGAFWIPLTCGNTRIFREGQEILTDTAGQGTVSPEAIEGGREIEIEAELGTIPCFVRCGSILPMEEGLQYAGECVDTPFIIRIYPGADAEFCLYEDDGDGTDYRKGRCNRIRMLWKEKEEIFEIGPAKYAFPGGIKGRRLRVVCRDQVKEFLYSGEGMRLCLRKE